MVVNYGYFGRDNNKVLKFHRNDSTVFENKCLSLLNTVF